MLTSTAGKVLALTYACRVGGSVALTRVAVSAPAGLGAPADDVGEDVGGGPRIGVVDQGVYLVVCGVVDAEALFDELAADVGFLVVCCGVACG